MKVISPSQMQSIESHAFKDGASESDFMEEAGSGVALIVHDYVERNNLDHTAILLCGKGNNAGDAYVAGINLLQLDYKVFAVQTVNISECTPLCKQNYERFVNDGGLVVETLSEFPSNGIIVDGLFGTGFRGSVEEPFSTLIQLANDSRLPIIAIDIPSGLNGETGEVATLAIIASETAFLGLPKTGFFLRDGWNHVGKIRYVDFGLSQHYIEESKTDLGMISEDIVKTFLPTIKRNQHKYEAGYVVGLSGSPSFPGAALLSASSALRGGAGIVKLLHPAGMEEELSGSLYELIKVPYHVDNPQPIIDLLNHATATYIGPGLGVTPQTRKLLREVIPFLQKPCVIDADALTIISEENLPFPKNCILTPHHGEMARLLKIKTAPPLSMDFLKICQEFCQKNQVTLVLKGGPTFIFQTGSPIMVNPTGDPGMATAGTGDVLTGLTASFLSQGMSPHHAAQAAVFLHGLAGEHAADEMTSRGVIASDLINRFPEAFKFETL